MKVGAQPTGLRVSEMARSQQEAKKLHESQVKGCMVEARVDKKRSQDTTDTWFLQVSSPLFLTDEVVEKRCRRVCGEADFAVLGHSARWED